MSEMKLLLNDLHAAVARDEEVSGLQVAMNRSGAPARADPRRSP
jgi:hypothetical protein